MYSWPKKWFQWGKKYISAKPFMCISGLSNLLWRVEKGRFLDGVCFVQTWPCFLWDSSAYCWSNPSRGHLLTRQSVCCSYWWTTVYGLKLRSEVFQCCLHFFCPFIHFQTAILTLSTYYDISSLGTDKSKWLCSTDVGNHGLNRR